MQLSSAPAKLVEAFAAGTGDFNVIPVPSQAGITPGAASWFDGFPALTMIPPISGGVPPSGLDMNGIVNALSALLIWFNAGAGFVFDATFASTVGGYPKGAKVFALNGNGYWLSTIDNNSNNPDTGGSGWTLQGASASSSVYASAQQTLASGPAKVQFDTVEFDEGLWNSGTKRFVAPFAGKYRVSGSILLAAPSGQNLSTQIWKNGTGVKQCIEIPQVSNGNLSLPFEGIINCSAGDYLEVYIIGSASVLAGISGSNQAFVFAQCSYVGA